MTLEGKRIVVLGGSSVIGLATAQAAAREGASVVIASSRKARVDEALAMLPAHAEGHVLDLADGAAVQALFARLGRFDHLVFTAGETLQLGSLATTDVEAARRFFDVRYWGAIRQRQYPRRRLHRVLVGNRRAASARGLGAGCERLLGHGGADTGAGGGAGADSRQHRRARHGPNAAVGGDGGRRP